MVWEVNTTEVFAEWYSALTEPEQDEIIAIVELLAEQGPNSTGPTPTASKAPQFTT